MATLKILATLPFLIVKAASTGAGITHSGEQTLDGVALVAGDLFLDKDNADATLAKIFQVQAGTWNLVIPDVGDCLHVLVRLGTANADHTFRQTATIADWSADSATWVDQTGGAAGGMVTLTGSQELTNKTLTAMVVKTGLTASGSASNDFSASTGTFKTSSGTNTLSGSTTLAANKDLTCAAGTTALDFSLGTGIFKTPSGAGTLSGSTAMAANKDLTCAAGTTALDFSLGTGIFKSPSGANTLSGDVTIAAAKNLSMAAGAGSVDFSAATGTYKTPTGVHTFGGPIPQVPLTINSADAVTWAALLYLGVCGTVGAADPAQVGGTAIGAARKVSTINATLSTADATATFTFSARYSTDHGATWTAITGASVAVANTTRGNTATFTPVTLPADCIWQVKWDATGAVAGGHTISVSLY